MALHALVSFMDDRTDLIGALFSEAAGLLEEAASLAPIGDHARLIERIDRIQSILSNAMHVMEVVKVLSRSGLQSA